MKASHLSNDEDVDVPPHHRYSDGLRVCHKETQQGLVVVLGRAKANYILGNRLFENKLNFKKMIIIVLN